MKDKVYLICTKKGISRSVKQEPTMEGGDNNSRLQGGEFFIEVELDYPDHLFENNLGKVILTPETHLKPMIGKKSEKQKEMLEI